MYQILIFDMRQIQRQTISLLEASLQLPAKNKSKLSLALGLICILSTWVLHRPHVSQKNTKKSLFSTVDENTSLSTS